MQSPPESDSRDDRPHSGSPLRRLFQRLRARRSDQLEERDWRRRIILASRRIQQIHIALTEDIAEVRGLKSDIASARPEIERLEQILTDAGVGVANLEFSIREHTELVASQSQDVRVVEDARQSVQRVGELESLLESEREAHRAAETRASELDAEVDRLRVVDAELSQAREQARSVRDERTEEVTQLEGRLQALEEEHAAELTRLEEGRDARSADALAIFKCHEVEVDELKRTFEAETVARESEVQSEKELRQKAEAELDRAQLSARTRIAELEAEAATAVELAEVEVCRREEWERTAAEFEERIEHMTTLVANLDGAGVQLRDSGESAAIAARMLELEGYTEDMEHSTCEGRARHSQELIDLSTGFEADVADLTTRLRSSEISRLESVTNAEREMTDFADHTLERSRALDVQMRERDGVIENLRLEIESLLRDIRTPVGAHSVDGAKPDQLVDLMREDGASAELDELPELPDSAEPWIASEDSADS